MLNARQDMFVREYLVDLNATQAAIRAGYSVKTAYSQGERLLKHVEVAAAIQEAMDKRAARVEINQDYVLNTIRETIDRCRQVEPVYDRKGERLMVEDRNGDMVPAFVFDSTAVLKGCDLLGKHLKLWKEVGSSDNPMQIEEIKITLVKPS